VDLERPVLITGGAGFIGRPLVSALLGAGHHVRVVVRRADAAGALAALGAECVIGDLLDRSTIERAVAGAGSIFHLAGRLFSAGSRSRDYTRLHVDATIALLEASAAEKPRPEFFVLCSTTGVHGPTGARPAQEDDAPHPQNAYESSKAEAERSAGIVSARLGLPLTVARPGLVYGPGDMHLAGWFRAIRAGYYRVIGGGENRLHPIFVDDAVRGLLLCASAARPGGRAYHLVGPQAVTMRELSQAIGRAVGRPVPAARLPAPLAFALGAACEALPVSRRVLPLTRSRVRFMTQNRAYDGSRAREELGFVAETGLEDGLARTVAWYRGQGLL
jgi:nucleoside-diphosphate-sugar epimerase